MGKCGWLRHSWKPVYRYSWVMHEALIADYFQKPWWGLNLPVKFAWIRAGNRCIKCGVSKP